MTDPEPLNLLFVSAYTGLGGGESVQLNLMGALDRRFRVHLVCPREGQLPDAARSTGAAVHIVPYRGINTWFVPAIWSRLPIGSRPVTWTSAPSTATTTRFRLPPLPPAPTASPSSGTRWAGGSRPSPGSAASSASGSRRSSPSRRPCAIAGWPLPPRRGRIARSRAAGHRAGCAAGGDDRAFPAREGA